MDRSPKRRVNERIVIFDWYRLGSETAQLDKLREGLAKLSNRTKGEKNVR
jgi:hypothetical protein